MSKILPRILSTAALCLAFSHTAAMAQTMTGEDFVSLMDSLNSAVEPPKYLSMQGVPSARVAPGGTVFMSISGADKRAQTGEDIDGSLAVGAAFGDAEQGIGAQVHASITSADPDDFGDSGYLGAKFGGRVLRDWGQNYLALSISNLAPWGDSKDEPVTGRLIGTKVVRMGPFANGESYPVMLTAGIGSHVTDDEDPGVFGGIGVGLTQNLSVSLSHDGDQLHTGFGLRTDLPGKPTFSATLSDPFDDEDDRRISLTVGFALTGLY